MYLGIVPAPIRMKLYLVVDLDGVDVVPAGVVCGAVELLLEELVKVLAADGACGLGPRRLRVRAHCHG